MDNIVIKEIPPKKDCHRIGVGQKLIETAMRYSKNKGCRYMTIETLNEKNADAA